MNLTYLVLGLLIAGATLLARGSARRLVAGGAAGILVSFLAQPFAGALGAFSRHTLSPTGVALAPVYPLLWLPPVLALVALALAAGRNLRAAAVAGLATGVAAFAVALAWWNTPQFIIAVAGVPYLLEIAVPLGVLGAAVLLARGLPRRRAIPVLAGGAAGAALLAAFLISPSAPTYFDALRGYYKVARPATPAELSSVVRDWNADLTLNNADVQRNSPGAPALTPISSAAELPSGYGLGRDSADAGVRRVFPQRTAYGFGAWLLFATLLTLGGAGLLRRGEEAAEGGDLAGGLVLAGVVAVLAASFNGVEFQLGRLVAGWPFIQDFLGRSWPPDFAGFLSDTLRAMTITLQTALVGTVLAAALALPASLLAARNLTEKSPVGRVGYGLTRVFFNVDRGVDTLIIALIFVAAVGLGPFAGVLAMAIHSMADLGKLYSEAIENADKGPIEALESAGAPGTSIVRWAVLPQVLPLFVSYTLYRFEINFRVSIVLGFVGAGGIGFLVNQTMRAGEYAQAVVAILAIVATVNLLDFTSAAVRRRIIG